MVFKNDLELINFIKNYKSVPKWVTDAREYHKEMKALIYGDDYKGLLLCIEHIETEKKALARKKYARPIKDINEKLLNPVNNVYSATGGGKEYNIKSEEQKKTLLHALSNVRGGLSLERWLEKFWSKDLYNVDPSGLMFLEWDIEKAYPTYKSIDCIRDYEADGLSVEWVLFEPTKADKEGNIYWRFVNSEKDYLVKQNGELFTIVEDKTFANPFGTCPGRVNSDVERLGERIRFAPIDSIVPTEREFLRDRSILTIYKFLNGFPIPYSPKVICPTCHGTGKNGNGDCSDCNGKGIVMDKDVTSEIIIPIDLTAENPTPLPTNFAGYIKPELETWNQYNKESQKLFKEMFETLWGTRESEEVKDQTAMGVILNTQPMISRLNDWSNIAQSHEHSFTEMLANFYIPTKNKNERISIISYGRNYIIQPPEFLLGEYQKSRESNDPVTVLDRKLIEYLTSKYKNDPETLRVELIKKVLEPYVHYDINTVKSIYGQREAQKKGLFVDWWEHFETKDFTDLKKLESEMNAWINEKISNLAILPQNTNINQDDE